MSDEVEDVTLAPFKFAKDTAEKGGELIQSGYDKISGRDAIKDAEKAKQKAYGQAGAVQLKMFDESMAATAPWRAAGGKALNQLTDIYGMNGDEAANAAFEKFQTSPNYAFNLAEMNKASNAAAAAGGRFTSMSQQKALQKGAFNLANQEFGNYTNNLARMSDWGRGMATNDANMMNNYGTNAANNITGAANSAANADIASHNAGMQFANQMIQFGSMAMGGMPTFGGGGAPSGGGGYTASPGYGYKPPSVGYNSANAIPPAYQYSGA